MERDGPGGGAAGAEDGAPLASQLEAPRRWPALRWAATWIVALAIGQAFVVLFASLRLIRAPLAGATPEQLFVITVLQDVPWGIALIALASLWLRIPLRDLARELGLIRPTSRAMGFALFAGVGGFLAGTALEAVQRFSFGSGQQSVIQAIEGHRGLGAFALDLVSGVVIAPFVEELAFRGVLFIGLRQRFGFVAAAVVSAAAFAVVHGLDVVLPIFVAGLVLAYVFQRTGSLLACYLCHATFNLIPLALVAFLPR